MVQMRGASLGMQMKKRISGSRFWVKQIELQRQPCIVGLAFLEGCENIAHQNKLRKKRTTELKILCRYQLSKEKSDQLWVCFIQGMLASVLVQ
jgi:hypothetical protein